MQRRYRIEGGGRSIDLERPVMLGPMEGYSDRAFRSVCRALGADLVFTEFASSDALAGRRSRRGAPPARLAEKVGLGADESPVGIQLYGNDPGRMAEAARVVADLGPDLVDLNFGCPSKDDSRGHTLNGSGNETGNATRNDARSACGSQLLREPDRVVAIAEAVVGAVALPVTCKLRLGWDERDIVAVALARRLEAAGVAALTVHGRTRCQKYRGRADWGWIARVAEAVSIPVVGNGDLASVADVARAFGRAPVAGVMISRAALRDPWLFARCRAWREGRRFPAPTPAERLARCREHLLGCVAQRGPRRGLPHMRSRYEAWWGGLPGFPALRRELVRLDDVDAVLVRLERYAKALEAREAA